VTVPTVERGFWVAVFCSIEMAGREPFDGIDVGLLHQAEGTGGRRR